ncbi:MAG: hypothetical protein V4642_02565 [Bacteroidota bacterium]
MKKAYSIFFLLILIASPLFSQTQKYFFKEINWQIEIPESWRIDIQVNKTHPQFLKFFYIKPSDTTINNNIATADLYKYFPDFNQDWLSSRKAKNDYSTKDYKFYFPNCQIDTASGTELIDGLEFQRFNIKLTTPNGVPFHTIKYSRLFGEYEFTLNLDFLDEKIGEEFLKMWRTSKFKKP